MKMLKLRRCCNAVKLFKEVHSKLVATTMSSSAAEHRCRRLEGKVAVVTASTDGIGLAIAERLGQEGAHVIISSRKQVNVDSALQRLKQQGLSVEGMVCHAGKKEDRQQLLHKADELFGGVDILVSNAGANPVFGPLFDTSEEAWDKIFEVNVKAAFFLCKEAIPYMEKRGGGSIILVSSILGYDPTELMGAYAVSKTALLGLCKVMAKPCVKKNIRINAIAPGLIKTKFSKAIWRGMEKHQGAETGFSIPLQRLGMPEECAGAVAFLSSDDSSYITGETIVMAGGMLSRL